MWHTLNPAVFVPLFGNVIVVGVDGCEDASVPEGVVDAALTAHCEVEITGWFERIRAAHG
ncbi:hypothetical protein [Mycobacterium servetii]|uniref:Uncharacterized protein n=1 Tax=Mycobacterium servetii TaxID=3237418 RepID=A0ABV4BUF4_9MYCO